MKKAESKGSVFQQKKMKKDNRSRQEKDKKTQSRPIIDLNERPDKWDADYFKFLESYHPEDEFPHKADEASSQTTMEFKRRDAPSEGDSN